MLKIVLDLTTDEERDQYLLVSRKPGITNIEIGEDGDQKNVTLDETQRLLLISALMEGDEALVQTVDGKEGS